VRERAGAIIERDGLLLMVRHRARGESGRHDGEDYLTLPGGGIEEGETAVDAVSREVREEVGLRVVSAAYLRRVEHPGGATTLFDVVVAAGAPALGTDPDLTCDCPRLVGLEWVTAPSRSAWKSDDVRSLLKVRLDGSLGPFPRTAPG
jgi:8-oxo-dGTP diphosphatase